MTNKNNKIFRVWRSIDGTLDGRYNGFEELRAGSPAEAADVVFEWDFEDGMSHYYYVVDQIAEFGGDVVKTFGFV